MRPLVVEYNVPVEQHFVNMAGYKAIPAVSLNPSLQGNWLHINQFSTFCQHENVILQGL
jgi:hypothetical protein